MTPLFPEDNASIKIRQGSAGDCYLLAALDCLYNHSPECRSKLRSMFHEKSNGDVEIRIKHSSLVRFRNPAIVRAKYQFREGVGEDIITIPKAQLERIDNAANGVQTNSLAVKILERISSYYFTGQLDHFNNDEASLGAHNDLDNRHTNTTTDFINQLLNVYIEETPLAKIIKYKLAAQDEPVYIEMDYGGKDAHGKYHGYHALRLQKILKNPHTPGGYDFVLVNPWDTSKTETYSIGDIQKRRPRFCIVSATLAQNQFNWSLINNLSAENARNLFASQSLYQLLWYVNQKKETLDFAKINAIIALYRQYPFTVEELHNLTNTEKDSLYAYLISPNPLDIKGGLIQAILEESRSNEFESLVNKAIQEKSKDYVEKNLCDYYFQKKGINLTRAGKLREVFYNKFYLTDIGTSHRLKPQLLLTGLGCIITNYNIPDYGYTFIKNWKSELTEKQFNEVMRELKPNATCIDVFKNIYSLHKLNPLLGERFFKFALNDLPTRFKMSIDEIRTKIEENGQTPFSQWFEKLNPRTVDLHLKGKTSIESQERAPRDIIDTKVEQIQNIQVKYRSPGVEKQKIRYLKEVDAIITSLALNHNRVPSALLEAKINKVNEIESEYAQVKITESHSRIINEAHASISQFYSDFPSVRSETRLTELYNEKIRQLKAITDNPNYLNALKKLKYTENPQHIAKVINLTLQSIDKNYHKALVELKRTEAQNLLIQSGLLIQLRNLKSKVANLEDKFKESPVNYKEARDVAKALYEKLKSKCKKFDDISKIKDFKEKCKTAIETAQPVLEKHRGYKEILAVIASILVTIGTASLANLWAGKLLLFKPTTESMKKVGDFRDTLNDLPDNSKP